MKIKNSITSWIVDQKSFASSISLNNTHQMNKFFSGSEIFSFPFLLHASFGKNSTLNLSNRFFLKNFLIKYVSIMVVS